MNFKIEWHPYEVARRWPHGSVVVCRFQSGSHILVNHFMPEAPMWEQGPWEQKGPMFILLAEPKQNNQGKK